MDPRGYDKVVRKPPPRMPFAGDRWLEIVAFSVRECARLGLESTINLSDCGGSLKGPWLTGPDCPKRLVVGLDVDGTPTDFARRPGAVDVRRISRHGPFAGECAAQGNALSGTVAPWCAKSG